MSINVLWVNTNRGLKNSRIKQINTKKIQYSQKHLQSMKTRSEIRALNSRCGVGESKVKAFCRLSPV